MSIEKLSENLKGIDLNISSDYLKSIYSQDIFDAVKDAWNDKYIWNGFAYMYAPSISSEDFLEEFDFKKIDHKYPALEWKTITDIGSGFGSLPFELIWSGVKLSLVDPVFASNKKDKLKLLDENISNIEKDIFKWNELIDNRNTEINNFYSNKESDFSNKWRSVFAYGVSEANKKLEIIEMIKTMNKKREFMKTDLQKWKLLTDNPIENVELHWSIWENITTIPDNSQDYVFISCVLDKECVQAELILAEASRILKPEWKIYMIHDHHRNLLRFLNKHDIPYKEKKWHYISILNKSIKKD